MNKPAKTAPRKTPRKSAAVPPHATAAAFDALSAADKERVWDYYDREFDPAERRRFEADRRRPGRPKAGQGAERVNVTIERNLLERADAFAARANVSRAQLIAEGLELRLKSEGPRARAS